MLYKSTTAGRVIAKVIRDTGLQDSAWLGGMDEWIPESMNLMGTYMGTEKKYEDIEIVFHRGKLPCALQYINAVEYGGYRLRYGMDVRSPQGNCDPVKYSTGVTVFDSIPVILESERGTFKPSSTAFLDSLSVLNTRGFYPGAWYDVEMDWVNTSIQAGWLRVHYEKRPTDAKGLPLIPDEANYREALYYFIRAKMVGAGYKDQVFKEETLMQRFELYAARAIENIEYPHIDQMENRVEVMTRLVPDDTYWENFMQSDKEPYYAAN